MDKPPSTESDISRATPTSARGVPSYATMELAVAALIFGIGALGVYDSYRLGSGWGSDGPRAGYFPFRIGVIICLCALFIFISALRHRGELRANFIEPKQIQPVLTVLVPSVIYVLCIEYLGIYVASSLFVALFMKFVGRFPWWKSLLVAVLMSIFTFYIFEKKFLVPLPKGPLETWLGY
jgi:putative tricarboxylic transport membrane protein